MNKGIHYTQNYNTFMIIFMHNINEISNIKKYIYDNFVLECITTGSIKII